MDLKFSIIADVARAGWDKAKRYISELTGSFDGMFRSSVGGWGKFAAGATGAFAAVIAGARKMRDGVLRELEKMENADIQFADISDRFNRKERMVSTQDEKDKLLEAVTREARDLRNKQMQLQRREDTQDPVEIGKDYLERKMNAALGLGNKTDAERELEHIGDQLKQLEMRAERIKKLRVESRFDAFSADESKFNQEQARIQNIENTTDPIAKEKLAAQNLADATAEFEKAKEAFMKAPNDEQAETNTKRAFELVQKLTAEWKSAADAADNYDPPAFTPRSNKPSAWASSENPSFRDSAMLGVAVDSAKKHLLELQDIIATNPGDEKAKAKLEKQVEFVKSLEKALIKAKDAAANYKPPAISGQMGGGTAGRKKPEVPEGQMGGGTAGRKKPEVPEGQMGERDKRGRLINPPEPDYGPEMGNGLTKSSVGKLGERHAFGFGSRGGHVSKFHTPAFLERALESRTGATQGDDNKDPRLIEMKRHTQLLENIDKKTGAAP